LCLIRPDHRRSAQVRWTETLQQAVLREACAAQHLLRPKSVYRSVCPRCRPHLLPTEPQSTLLSVLPITGLRRLIAAWTFQSSALPDSTEGLTKRTKACHAVLENYQPACLKCRHVMPPTSSCAPLLDWAQVPAQYTDRVQCSARFDPWTCIPRRGIILEGVQQGAQILWPFLPQVGHVPRCAA